MMKTKDYGHLKLLIPEKEDRMEYIEEVEEDFGQSAVRLSDDSAPVILSVSPLYTIRINSEAYAELTIERKQTINRGMQTVIMIYARKAGSDKKAYVCGRVVEEHKPVNRELIEDAIRQVTSGTPLFWCRFEEEFG